MTTETDELHTIFRSRVGDRFSHARRCLAYARQARQDGDSAEAQRWLYFVGVMRTAAARWRRRAQSVLPTLGCFVWLLHGCAKAPLPSRELSADFEVQPAPDGRGIVWTLQFRSRAQYHALLESTADGDERQSVRKLIAAGLQLHRLVGCSAHEQAITKLGHDGIAFVGSCSLGAHATPAIGGI
jgi:hypothetical protein